MSIQEYFNQVGLDANLYLDIEYHIENSDTIVLAGYIDTPINIVFDKVKTIIVLNCNYEFLFYHLDRKHFPNVKRVLWFNPEIQYLKLLSNFNYESDVYNPDLCKVYIDPDYTDYQEILIYGGNRHINMVKDIFNHYIENYDGYYYIKLSGGLVEYSNYCAYFNIWKNKFIY